MEESIFGESLFLIGALLVAISLFMNDWKRFRLLYLVASMIYIIYGIVVDNPPIIFTSAIFLVINIYFLSKLGIQFREVRLPGRFLEVYEIYKSYITTGEFNQLVDKAKEKTYLKETLIEKGQDVSELMLIINGKVDIISDGKVINTIGPGNFIGEFGMLTGNKATATVHCNSIVEVSSWTKYTFESEKSLRKLVSVNLVNKLIDINKHKTLESISTEGL